MTVYGEPISKLPNVGTSIFTTMSQLSSDHGALNLSQGFPDFDADKRLVDLVNHHMKSGRNQYAPSNGIPKLRKEIADLFSDYYGAQINWENNVTITVGATEAIYASLAGLISPGDEVIIFDPSYDSYDPVVRLNGGIPVRLKLRPADFSVDWDQVESRIGANTRIILINSPHNPTGAILEKTDLERLQEIAIKNDLIVVSDEVYHHIIFDGQRHESVLRYPELAMRSVAIFSFGKIFHATGWKVGFAIASETLTREIQKIHQFLTFSVHTPTQFALADYMEEGLQFESISKLFEKKRDLFVDQLDNPRFIPVRSRGTYFQLLKYQDALNDMALATKMTKEARLASIPISVFYEDGFDDHVLRFCFAKEDETIMKAVNILNAYS